MCLENENTTIFQTVIKEKGMEENENNKEGHMFIAGGPDPSEPPKVGVYNREKKKIR